MRYHFRPLLFSFILPSLFRNDLLVSGGRIHLRSKPVVQDVSPNRVDVPGLNFFAGYLCPNAANVKRGTVAVPIDQLNTVLEKLMQMEEAVLVLISQYNTAGELDSSDPSGVFVGEEDGEQVVSISDSSPSAVGSGSPGSAVSSLSPPLSSASYVAAASTAVASVAASSAVTSSVAASSSVASSVAASSAATSSATQTNAAASCTTTSDFASAASSTSLLSVAAPTTNSAISAQTSSAPDTGSSPTDSAPPAAPTSGYTFNAQSSKNVAVYFGQTPVTSGTTLALQCADPNVDIVILAFVIAASDGGQYPEVNFGAACGGQTSEMMSDAPGLLSCPQLAADITTCQTTYGKKVFLSIGGSASQISLPTETSASTFATMMWNLFGPPGNVDVGLRPFGTVQLDGFDVGALPSLPIIHPSLVANETNNHKDNEDNISSNWGVFASTLRTYFASYESKPYYLSSAPQCPFPDASNPIDLLLLCDFVWVQFYNNPPCEIGSSGFTASLSQWSSALQASTMAVQPKLYLGAPAFSAAGSSAYAAIGSAEGMQGIAQSVEGMGLSNFGGVMFWDGPGKLVFHRVGLILRERLGALRNAVFLILIFQKRREADLWIEGMLNTDGGMDILGWAKAGLNS